MNGRWGLISFLCLLFLAMSLQSTDSTMSYMVDLEYTSVHVVTDLEDHSPIVINNNTDFITQGWPGTGTPLNPYRIENLSINQSIDNAYCIEIHDTTSYFAIRNCLMYGSTARGGVRLVTAMNGEIKNCTFNFPFTPNWGVGVRLESSDYIDIINNTCSCFGHGISLIDSDYNLVFNNTCNGGSDGIWLDGSDWNVVSNNTSNDHTQGGMMLAGSSSNTVANNSISNNQRGIYLGISPSNTILNNEMYGCGFMVQGQITTMKQTLVENNTVNGKPALFIQNQIGGMISGNVGDLTLIDCQDMIIDGLTLGDSTYGANLFYCNNVTMRNCVVTGFPHEGIRLISCAETLLENNTVSEGTTGFTISGGSNNLIRYNTAHNLRYGISVSGTGNTAIWNTFRDASDYDAYSTAANLMDYNYYSGYSGIDENSDGIGDTNYTLEGGAVDEHPLVYYHLPPEWVIVPSDIQVEEGIGISEPIYVTSYAPLDQFWVNDTTHFSLDESAILTNASVLSAGNYGLEIWVNNIYGLNVSAGINVTVEPPAPPVFLTPPTDIIVEFGRNFHLDINAIDTSGIDSWSVNDTSHFTISASGNLSNIVLLSVGQYGVRVNVTDNAGHSAFQDWNITVRDTTPPEWVVTPQDQILEYWLEYLEYDLDATDLSGISAWWLNDTSNFAISSSGMITNSTNTYIGVYPLQVVVVDLYDNTLSSVLVIVVNDTQIPFVVGPSSYAFIEGTAGHSIVYSAYDLTPTSYIVLIDSTLNRSGPWNSTSEILAIGLDGLTQGVYNFTVIFADGGGNTGHIETLVTVIRESEAILSSPDDIEFEAGYSGNIINWTATNLNPGVYTILQDGIPIESGNLNDTNVIFIIDLDDLYAREYNFTIILSEYGFTNVADTVWVVVLPDTTPPVVTGSEDITFETGESGNFILWHIYDLNPDGYAIYRNGTRIIYDTFNNQSFQITYHLDGLAAGVYEYWIEVSDYYGNNVTDVVIVTVTPGDLIPPTIDSPDDIFYVLGETGNEIVWTPQDPEPNYYEIQRNGTIIKWGQWNSTGETISVNVDGLEIGTYLYMLLISDDSWNNATDDVIVFVLDGPLSISSPDDIEYLQGTTGHEITWELTSGIAIFFDVYRNGSVLVSQSWYEDVYTINVDYLLSGSYNYTIRVFGIDGESVTDTVWVQVLSEGTTTPTSTTSDTTTTDLVDPGSLGLVVTLVITIGSFVIIIVFSARICQAQRKSQWAKQIG